MKRHLLPILLPVRSIVFLLTFIVCAWLAGTDLNHIGHWWSMIAVVVNILTIMLLVFAAHKNGQTFWQLINYRKGQTRWTTILWVTLLVLVVGMSGMYLAGFLCYGNMLFAPPVIIAPIAKWIAIINIVLLPGSGLPDRLQPGRRFQKAALPLQHGLLLLAARALTEVQKPEFHGGRGFARAAVSVSIREKCKVFRSFSVFSLQDKKKRLYYSIQEIRRDPRGKSGGVSASDFNGSAHATTQERNIL